MGTLAVQGAEEGLEVFIFTADKDAMQLVGDRVQLFNPQKEDKFIGPTEVRKRYEGLGPDQVIDIMA